jgi:hypothetical protein
VNKGLRVAGAFFCLIAVLVINGGHWAALQTFAWGRMLVAFCQHDSIANALLKTFDGRHPCALCVTVRTGLHQDQQQQKDQAPYASTERLPEPLWELRCAIAPEPQLFTTQEHPIVPQLASDFIDSPPSPPPRA